MFCTNVLPSDGTPERFSVCAFAVGWQFDASLQLQEAVGRQQLTDGDERLEDRHALAEAWVSLPVGSRTSAAALTMVPRFERVKERVLDRDRDVAEPVLPGVRTVLLHGQWHRELDLAARAEPSLVEQHVVEGRGVAAADRRRQEGLVFREGLFGDEGARQVELSTRPGALGAEAAHVVDRSTDLVLGQHLAERRHPAIEGAHGSALVRDR